MIGVAGSAGRSRRQSAGEWHDQVAARDQRLLVGRGNDLARLERGEDGPQRDQPARGNDHKINVRTRGNRPERTWAAYELGTGGEFQPGGGSLVGEGDHRRPKLSRLLLEDLS